MSKLLLLLVILFVVAIGAFFALTFSYSKSAVFESISRLKATPAQNQTTIAITPNVLTVTSGQPTTASIVFTAKSHTPRLIQLEIAYEPALLTNIVIEPGNYFVKPDVSLNTINPRIGRISYAIEASDKGSINKNGTVIATITFTPLLSAYNRQTTLSFLPKTAVRDDEDNNSLKAAYGAMIQLLQPNTTIVTQPVASNPGVIQQ